MIMKADELSLNSKVRATLIVLLSVIILNTGCDPLIYRDTQKHRVSLCKLPKFEGDTVRVAGVYSGFEEYWSFHGRKCTGLKIELDLSGFEKLPEAIDEAFSEVHDNYYNSSLVLDITGVFSQGKPGGYGHLGSNNGNFKVLEFLSVKKVKSQ